MHVWPGILEASTYRWMVFASSDELQVEGIYCYRQLYKQEALVDTRVSGRSSDIWNLLASFVDILFWLKALDTDKFVYELLGKLLMNTILLQ